MKLINFTKLKDNKVKLEFVNLKNNKNKTIISDALFIRTEL